MSLRTKLGDLKQTLTPVFSALAVVAICVAIMWFLPAHTAALLLGILVAVLLYYLVVTGLQYTTQIAILWAGMGIAADAAYAKLNDQAPVTVVGALARVVDATVKLADGLIRAASLPVADVRGKLAASTPDFLWALILTLLALMIVNAFAKR